MMNGEKYNSISRSKEKIAPILSFEIFYWVCKFLFSQLGKTKTSSLLSLRPLETTDYKNSKKAQFF